MKKILVLGLGKSGLAASELLLKQGREVVGFDDAWALSELKGNFATQYQEGVRLLALGLCVLKTMHDVDWEAIDTLIVSPGIAKDHEVYKEALQRKIEVIGEVELALRYLNQSMVAITGTNGKTTVALLMEHILKTAGRKARSIGNIGVALSSYVLYRDLEEILVVELSSFQLETVHSQVFDAGIILNITPDHLDRYSDMESYARVKCHLQNCLKPEAAFFVQQAVARQYGYLISKPHLTFGHSWEKSTEKRSDISTENIEYIFPKLYRKLSIHDRENALAAWVLCRPYGISNEQFCCALESFKKPSHRIEFVSEIDGICYYDDSKGTNIDAVIHAVEAMPGSVILIAGGVDKGSSYLPWVTGFKNKVKRILVLGEAALKMRRELSAFFEIEHVDSLSIAVEKARDQAKEGDCILLSPGCSSYDMFTSYVHRGQEFQRCVLEKRRKLHE